MKYNIFDLYVVDYENYKFICRFDMAKKVYIEALTNTKIETDKIDSLESLSNYYSPVKKITHSVEMDKNSILDMYVLINNKQFDIYLSDESAFIEYIEKRTEQLKYLNKINPKLAKLLAIKSLNNVGIINGKGEIIPPYDEVFVKQKKK